MTNGLYFSLGVNFLPTFCIVKSPEYYGLLSARYDRVLRSPREGRCVSSRARCYLRAHASGDMFGDTLIVFLYKIFHSFKLHFFKSTLDVFVFKFRVDNQL